MIRNEYIHRFTVLLMASSRFNTPTTTLPARVCVVWLCRYSVSCTYALVEGPGTVSLNQTGTHAFALFFSGAGASHDNQTVELSCAFESVCCVGPKPPGAKNALAGKPVVAVADAISHTTAM